MATRPANPETGECVGIAILAKAPVAGLAKTRLIPVLGADGAARLQHWMLQRIVRTALAARLGPVTLWCAPDAAHPAFHALAVSGLVRLSVQPAGDLGVRMATALADCEAAGGTLIVGTDCPQLQAGDLQRAAHALRDHEAVVAPAEDGGYVLIGSRQADPRLFADVTWSTDQVMAQTRQRLAALHWRHVELGGFWDVDVEEDYYRLLALFPELSRLVGPGHSE